MTGQIELFRQHALGNFRELLDRGRQRSGDALLARRPPESDGAPPQENFGRELMELFTFGVEHYVETDVYAAARVFTGWNLRADGHAGLDVARPTSSRTTPHNHDTDAKDFSFPIYRDGSRRIPARAASSRHAGRARSDQRARHASGNGEAHGAPALDLVRERNRDARPGVRGQHLERVSARTTPT